MPNRQLNAEAYRVLREGDGSLSVMPFEDLVCVSQFVNFTRLPTASE